MEPSDASSRLYSLRRELKEDLPKRGPDARFLTWRDEVKIVLQRAYGENSSELARFEAISFSSGQGTSRGLLGDKSFRNGVKQAESFLASRIEELDLRAEAQKPQGQAKRNRLADFFSVHKRDFPSSRKVFVIHGHDHGMKDAVARFLTKLGLDPVILHEEADKGRTIIEKFEQHSDAAFAIALFSSDDLGATNAEIGNSEPKRVRTLLRPRARQNVVFECGYFIGKLGRDRVAMLQADGVEMMSDYAGVVYIPFDAANGWQARLLKELNAAQFNLDANKIL